MNDCLMTPQHEKQAAIGCHNKVNAWNGYKNWLPTRIIKNRLQYRSLICVFNSLCRQFVWTVEEGQETNSEYCVKNQDMRIV